MQGAKQRTKGKELPNGNVNNWEDLEQDEHRRCLEYDRRRWKLVSLIAILEDSFENFTDSGKIDETPAEGEVPAREAPAKKEDDEEEIVVESNEEKRQQAPEGCKLTVHGVTQENANHDLQAAFEVYGIVKAPEGQEVSENTGNMETALDDEKVKDKISKNDHRAADNATADETENDAPDNKSKNQRKKAEERRPQGQALEDAVQAGVGRGPEETRRHCEGHHPGGPG